MSDLSTISPKYIHSVGPRRRYVRLREARTSERRVDSKDGSVCGEARFLPVLLSTRIPLKCSVSMGEYSSSGTSYICSVFRHQSELVSLC